MASARREELLDELVGLFLAEGFREFTLADLAERLHCSKTTLYAFGRSKEQLTTNVVVRFFQLATDAVEAASAAQADPAEWIVAYLQAVAEALRPASTAFIQDVGDHPTAAAVYERNTSAAAKRVAEHIDDGIVAGVFRRVHGAFVADTVAATMRRIQTGEIFRSTGLHDAQAYDELAELILNGIST